jgi:hypothetical protein
MTENKNMPAFPISCAANDTGTYSLLDSHSGSEYTGLSKREQIAAMALQGLLANPEIVNRSTADNKEWREDIALTATMVSDALFTELSKA